MNSMSNLHTVGPLIRDGDVIPSSTNEAYHVVKESEAIDISYEAVSTPPSPAYSTPHPPHQTTVDNSLYEPV